MKALSAVLALSALALGACDPAKPDLPPPAAAVKTKGLGEQMGGPPLNIELVKVQVIQSDTRGEDAIELDFLVKFANKGKDPIAFLNHPNSLKIEQMGESGKKADSFIQVKLAGPTPADVVQLEPGEEIVLSLGTRPTRKADLGTKFRARLVVWPWSPDGMKPNPSGISHLKLWPEKPMEAPWQKLLVSDAQARVFEGGGAKAEFLGLKAIKAGEAEFSGTAFEAKYRITNNSPQVIAHTTRPDGLGFVVTGSKGEYLTPYAAMDMMAMSVWDVVILAPGESKIIIRSTPPYRDPEMERTVKVKFSLSTWQPDSIEGLKDAMSFRSFDVFPGKTIESPIYEVERRH